MWFLTVSIVLVCGVWILGLARLSVIVLRLKQLRDNSSIQSETGEWPRLSIIIPACNEGIYIESALQSLLNQDYPTMELILVNDRSSDSTGEIIERLAAADTRIKAVHIKHLPDDWLGKVHALNRGLQHASGEWLLFTDADVRFAPGCLRRAMLYAKRTQADHLALLPGLSARRFWLTVAARTFGMLFLLSTRADLVDRTGNKYYVGVGAFNLVRRRTFDATPGFGWLKMEPGDDAALGMMIKQAGGKVRFAMAQADLVLDWYPNLRSMFTGMEKNLFGAGAHYQWQRVLLQTALAWLLVFSPLLGLYWGIAVGESVLIFSVITMYLVLIGFAVLHSKQNFRDFVCLVLFPAGILLINAMMIHAAYRCLRNQGIEWRGTHYALTKLKAGQRIQF